MNLFNCQTWHRETASIVHVHTEWPVEQCSISLGSMGFSHSPRMKQLLLQAVQSFTRADLMPVPTQAQFQAFS